MTAVGHAAEVEVEHGQRLQAFDEAVGVVVEDDTLVQQSFRVEDGLQLLHGLVGLVAPFVFHERCHVASCAMLCLQRAVVVLDHEFCYVAHHVGIAFHLAVALEALVQDEVIVALESMTVDAGIGIAVVGNELLQAHGGFGQHLDGEGHVLNQAGGAHGTGAAHRGEYA